MGINFSNLVLRPAQTIFARTGVIYTPPGGAAISGLRGVFDRVHEIVKIGSDGMEITTTSPVLGIRLTEWSTQPKQDGQIVVDGSTFRIFEVQPDGEGGADLIMKEIVV